MRKFAKVFPGTVAMALLAALWGCDGRKEAPAPAAPAPKAQVYESRQQDPEYKAQLETIQTEEKQVARRHAYAVSGLEALIAKARKVVGANATDDQVKAEIEAHPERYVGWKELQARLQASNAEIENQLEKARVNVRARILREVADQKAVKEGRAVVRPAAAKN